MAKKTENREVKNVDNLKWNYLFSWKLRTCAVITALTSVSKNYLLLREEVLNVSFFGNINRIRNRETKDFEKHLTGNFQNLTVQWVYENDTFVFKNSDTFYAWIGFLMRDGNTFWDVREYEIWYWRLHSLGVSTTTGTTTDLDDGMFDIFEPNLAKLHPELKKMLIPTSKTRRNSFSPKRYVTFSAQKVTKLKTWKEKETNTNENSWSV